jgi:hypothetical protein
VVDGLAGTSRANGLLKKNLFIFAVVNKLIWILLFSWKRVVSV